MPSPADLTASAVMIPGSVLRTGKVLDDASAQGDLVKATIPSIDSRLATNPMAWNPVTTTAGDFYPKRGDVALIAIPPDGPEVLVWWTPSATEPDLDGGAVQATISSTKEVAEEEVQIPGLSLAAPEDGIYEVTLSVDALRLVASFALICAVYVDGVAVANPRLIRDGDAVNERHTETITFQTAALSKGDAIAAKAKMSGGSTTKRFRIEANGVLVIHRVG